MKHFGFVWIQVNTDSGQAKDALVYVDGTLRVDHVPAKLLLSEGPHEVEVRKGGLKFDQNPRGVHLVANSAAKPTPLVFSAV